MDEQQRFDFVKEALRFAQEIRRDLAAVPRQLVNEDIAQIVQVAFDRIDQVIKRQDYIEIALRAHVGLDVPGVDEPSSMPYLQLVRTTDEE